MYYTSNVFRAVHDGLLDTVKSRKSGNSGGTISPSVIVSMSIVSLKLRVVAE